MPVGVVVSVGLALVMACSADDDDGVDNNQFRSDVLGCEDAVSHLIACCGAAYPRSALQCHHLLISAQGCTSNDTLSEQSPDLTPNESDCIRGESCGVIVGNHICERAAALLLAAVANDAAAQTAPPPTVQVDPAMPVAAPAYPASEWTYVNLHLESGYGFQHFAGLAPRGPDFGLGVGLQWKDGAVYIAGHFEPAKTSNELDTRRWAFEIEGEYIWWHLRFDFGVGFAFIDVDRASRDADVLGTFLTLNMGPRLDVLQLHPLTVFLRVNGMVGGGTDHEGWMEGATFGGGIEFDVNKYR